MTGARSNSGPGQPRLHLPLVLASESPRRRELLAILGIPFSVVAAAVDETPQPEETPEAFARRMAREKATDVAARVGQSIVLSADTVVAVDDEILGKPAGVEDAARMLRRLAGRRHAVCTAVCVFNPARQEMLEGIERTDVWFNAMSDAEIHDYIGRENVLDKAGAYAIQGYASVYIPRIEGNYSNVVGLPMPLVHQLLCRTSS